MSFVTLIKDYVDVTNSSYQLNGYTFSSLAYYTLAFLFSIIKQAIVYCFTFQWLQNFSYFCLSPPQLLSSFANLTGIEHQPLSNLIAFSENDSYTSISGIGLIFLGFFNGCFSCMHLSAANLVTIQRLLVQGVPAGICSAFGTAVGQCSFLACILFGFRGFLFPWLALEPLPVLIGTGILLIIASTTAQDRRRPTIQWSSKFILLIYTFTSILLAWCEQTSIFQLIGNINFGTGATLLETTPFFESIHSIFGNIQQLVKNISYLFAFFLGNFLGTFFLSYFLQRLLELLLRFKGIPVYYGLIKQANLPLATLIFAFGFGSLPYYGFDYLITKGFGFIPQEHFFQQTIFSPVNLVSKTSQTKEPSQSRLEDQLALLFTLEGEKNKSLVMDTTPFDDGQYLKAGQKRPQAFEDLNYRGEHLWTNRLSRISNIREQANQTQSSFLGPVFSWMRSFLWGNEPTTNNIPYKTLDKLTNSSTERKFLLENSIQTDKRIEDATPHAPLDKQSPNESNKIWVDNLLQKKELLPEREQTDNYVKEFERQFDKGFSNFYNAEPTSLIEIEDQWQEKRIKEKCYTNPMYMFLLNTEIDSFLSRQPTNHSLSPQEEFSLLKRRQLLSNYYDTLALTSQVSTSEALNQLVPKSYTNAIYNHQFKGTLKIARRLFSIKKVLNTKDSSDILHATGKLASFSYPKGLLRTTEGNFKDIVNSRVNQPKDTLSTNSSENISIDKRKVVKFDQPLFSKKDFNFQDLEKTIFHEELNNNNNLSSVNKQPQENTQSMESNEGIEHPFGLLRTTEGSPLAVGAKQIEGYPPKGFDIFDLHTPKGLAKQSTRSNPSYPSEEGTPLASKGKQGVMVTKGRQGVTEENTTGMQKMSKNPSEFDIRIKHGNSPAKTENFSKTSFKKSHVFLLEQTESLPLYASWDEDLRKLILTNRFQNQEVASYIYSEFPKSEKNFITHKKEILPLSFTSWPLPNPTLPLSTTAKINRVVGTDMNKNLFSEKNNISSNIDTYGASQPKDPTHAYPLPVKDIQEISDVYPLNEKKSKTSPERKTLFSSTQESASSEATHKELTLHKNNQITASYIEDVKAKGFFLKPTTFIKKMVDYIKTKVIYQNSKNQFLFQTFTYPFGLLHTTEGKNVQFKEPATNDMINALLQWQKLIKENKQLSKEDKQAAKEKVLYWPKNVSRANWSNELIDNDLEFDEPTENVLKKQTILWEFIPPNHGGFVWPGNLKMS